MIGIIVIIILQQPRFNRVRDATAYVKPRKFYEKSVTSTQSVECNFLPCNIYLFKFRIYYK